MTASPAATLSLALGVASAGCLVLDGFGDVAPPSGECGAASPSCEAGHGTGGNGGETSGGAPAGGGGGGGASPTCLGATPVAPPSATDGSGVTLVFALRQLDFGEADGAIRPGFNLDGSCTCCDECDTPTCTPPGTGEAACDTLAGDATSGRDDNTASVMKLYGQSTGATSESYSVGANGGTWGLLFAVSAYSGEPNDPSVAVAIYDSNGTPSSPKWDGTDAWSIRADSVDPRGQPLYVTSHAYVTDGVLVARFDDVDIGIQLPDSFGLRLGGAVLEAELGDSGLENGVLAGAWSMTDVFATMASMGLCKSDLFYETAKSALCNERDIGGAIGSPCDAISFGMSFAAFPAVLGDLFNPPPPIQIGTPDTDPSSDTCDG